MKRITVIAVLAAVLGTVAGTVWHGYMREDAPPPEERAVAAPPPPPLPARSGEAIPQTVEVALELPPAEPERVPLPPVDDSTPAWLAMAEAREHGDPRTPPVVHDAPEVQVRPSAAQLADPQAYHQFEQGQHARLLASFAAAARDEVPRLRADVERGRAAGVPEAELAKMEEKIRRIEALRAGVVEGAGR